MLSCKKSPSLQSWLGVLTMQWLQPQTTGPSFRKHQPLGGDPSYPWLFMCQLQPWMTETAPKWHPWRFGSCQLLGGIKCHPKEGNHLDHSRDINRRLRNWIMVSNIFKHTAGMIAWMTILLGSSTIGQLPWYYWLILRFAWYFFLRSVGIDGHWLYRSWSFVMPLFLLLFSTSHVWLSSLLIIIGLTRRWGLASVAADHRWLRDIAVDFTVIDCPFWGHVHKWVWLKWSISKLLGFSQKFAKKWSCMWLRTNWYL